MERNHASIQKLPDTPGVYFFIGKNSEVLYVGKATSLKDRVRSYFLKGLSHVRSVQIAQMVERALRVEWRETDSVLEALILEARLIKEFKPTYNTRDKDDKSFNHLIVTCNETYPRCITVRGKDLETALATLREHTETSRKKNREPKVFGPFPHAGQLKTALIILRKIFPFYDTKKPVEELLRKDDRRLRFNESIGLYPKQSALKSAYAKDIRRLISIFEGNLKKVIQSIEKEMSTCAKEERFEEASVLKRQLFALRHIQDVSLLQREREYGEHVFRIEGYDVAHLQGSDAVGVCVVVEGGVPDKREYRTFTIRNSKKGSDTDALREVLARRLTHNEWEYPRLIVLDGGKAQLNVAREVLKELEVSIPIVAVTKDDKHRPLKVIGATKAFLKYERDILLANSEAHRFSLATHKKKRAKRLKK